MLKGSDGSSMVPMKRRARDRMHETSGWERGSGAESDVRPLTRCVVPLPRLMKDSVKSAELAGDVLAGFTKGIGEGMVKGVPECD